PLFRSSLRRASGGSSSTQAAGQAGAQTSGETVNPRTNHAMTHLTRPLFLVGLIFALSVAAHAQGKNGFVGVWEEIGGTTAKGEPESGNVGMRRIFTADGFYSIAFGRQCAGTQVVEKPLQELTKEQ